MKAFNLFLLSALTVSSVAQNVAIGLPPSDTSVAAGSRFNIEIDRPRTLSSSVEVAVVIALQSCPSFTCAPPSDLMGIILYNGPFTPDLTASGPKPPNQNFSLEVPSTMPKGRAQLGVAHLALIGAGLMPWLETMNKTIYIV